MNTYNPFDGSDLWLPDSASIAHMSAESALEDPKAAIERALACPIGTESLEALARSKAGKLARAVIVASDNTRPVPYKGPGNMLSPIIRILLASGFEASQITILIATGMHKPMTAQQIRQMIDPGILELGVQVINHDPSSRLDDLGRTRRGTEVMIDSIYTRADLKIVTGLIESHFMAGASGGRKAICPGLIGERSTAIFHGPELMADPRSTNLVLKGNPVSEESLEIASLAGIDFLVNVTLDHSFCITGVFAGHYIKAHEAGVAFIARSVSVKAQLSDVVITHGGFVGINHYQCAKAAVASIPILRKDGYLIIIADLKDPNDKLGSANYRKCLSVLMEKGPEGFYKAITDPSWTFLVDQWQVQQWAKVIERIPMDHLYFYSPSLDSPSAIPGHLLESGLGFSEAVRKAMDLICLANGKREDELVITYIADGPYCVPQT